MKVEIEATVVLVDDDGVEHRWRLMLDERAARAVSTRKDRKGRTGVLLLMRRNWRWFVDTKGAEELLEIEVESHKERVALDFPERDFSKAFNAFCEPAE